MHARAHTHTRTHSLKHAHALTHAHTTTTTINVTDTSGTHANIKYKSRSVPRSNGTSSVRDRSFLTFHQALLTIISNEQTTITSVNVHEGGDIVGGQVTMERGVEFIELR